MATPTLKLVMNHNPNTPIPQKECRAAALFLRINV